MLQGFQCSTCGKWHDELPMSFGADAPYWYEAVAPEERGRRVAISSDQCVIDDEQFFVRGVLEIPVIDGEGPFTWGVWVSLSRKNFHRMADLWETVGRENEPPYFGWLSTAIPCYPDTLNLKTHVHTRPVGRRPSIELEPKEHPLALEQRDGITVARVEEIAECVLHE